MIIPTEARATLAAIRYGKTEAEYRADIWKRRLTEHPTKQRSRWNWPIKWAEAAASNVTPIKRKARQ